MGGDVQWLCAPIAAQRIHKESMSTQEVFVQHFARLFDHYQHALNSDNTESTNAQPRAWSALPADERNRMVAAARLAIMEMETNARLEDESRASITPSPAKPSGAAERPIDSNGSC